METRLIVDVARLDPEGEDLEGEVDIIDLHVPKLIGPRTGSKSYDGRHGLGTVLNLHRGDLIDDGINLVLKKHGAPALGGLRNKIRPFLTGETDRIILAGKENLLEEAELLIDGSRRELPIILEMDNEGLHIMDIDIMRIEMRDPTMRMKIGNGRGHPPQSTDINIISGTVPDTGIFSDDGFGALREGEFTHPQRPPS